MKLGKIIDKAINEYVDSEKEETNLNDNFWKWFGESKVVNDNNEPAVCYHATRTNFKVFNFKNSLQKIIWFTSDMEAIKNKEVGASGYAFTKELFVSMKNPCGWEEYNKYGLEEIKQKGFDGAVLKNKNGTYIGFVFLPNQIKSVDNDDTWDIGDNNIYS